VGGCRWRCCVPFQCFPGDQYLFSGRDLLPSTRCLLLDGPRRSAVNGSEDHLLNPSPFLPVPMTRHSVRRIWPRSGGRLLTLKPSFHSLRSFPFLGVFLSELPSPTLRTTLVSLGTGPNFGREWGAFSPPYQFSSRSFLPFIRPPFLPLQEKASGSPAWSPDSLSCPSSSSFFEVRFFSPRPFLWRFFLNEFVYGPRERSLLGFLSSPFF